MSKNNVNCEQVSVVTVLEYCVVHVTFASTDLNVNGFI